MTDYNCTLQSVGLHIKESHSKWSHSTKGATANAGSCEWWGSRGGGGEVTTYTCTTAPSQPVLTGRTRAVSGVCPNVVSQPCTAPQPRAVTTRRVRASNPSRVEYFHYPYHSHYRKCRVSVVFVTCTTAATASVVSLCMLFLLPVPQPLQQVLCLYVCYFHYLYHSILTLKNTAM